MMVARQAFLLGDYQCLAYYFAHGVVDQSGEIDKIVVVHIIHAGSRKWLGFFLCLIVVKRILRKPNKVGGSCCPVPPEPRLQTRVRVRQLGGSAGCYDVVVSCNKCKIIVCIYDYDLFSDSILSGKSSFFITRVEPVSPPPKFTKTRIYEFWWRCRALPPGPTSLFQASVYCHSYLK